MSTPEESVSQQLEAVLRRLEAPPIARPRDIFISEASTGKEGYYLRIGAGLGGLTGFATFIGAYIYCVSAYGFLLGLGLGWIPSGIVAVIVSQIVRFLWGPIIFLIVVLVARMNGH
jgi:hypothetical protein